MVPPGTYTLSAWVKTEGVGSGRASGLRLTFDARPAVNDWRATDVISGVHDWTRYAIPNIVVSRATTVQVVLESYRDPAGTAWFDDVVPLLQERGVLRSEYETTTLRSHIGLGPVRPRAGKTRGAARPPAEPRGRAGRPIAAR